MLARHRIEHLTPLLKMKTIHHNLLPDFKKERGKGGNGRGQRQGFFHRKVKKHRSRKAIS